MLFRSNAFLTRFQTKIFMGTPNKDDRYKFCIFYIKHMKMTASFTEEEFHRINTKYFSFRELENWMREAMDRGPWTRTQYAKHFRKLGDKFKGCYCDERKTFCLGKIVLDDKKKLKGKVIHSPLTLNDLELARRYHKPVTNEEEQVNLAEEIGAPRPVDEDYVSNQMRQTSSCWTQLKVVGWHQLLDLLHLE